MLGTIPVAEALTLHTPDANDHNHTVRDLTATKRRSPHYRELLANIRQHGITTPIVIRNSPNGGRYLADGHHRVTAAIDAGLTHIPFTDDWLTAHRIATRAA